MAGQMVQVDENLAGCSLNAVVYGELSEDLSLIRPRA
jgi:hypothetical protein